MRIDELTTRVGSGFCIVQSFEPIQLYTVLQGLGFEHHTEKISDNEYRAYFYRTAIPGSSGSTDSDLPLKPTTIVNLNNVDPNLADVAVNFWELIWGREDTAIDMKTRLLLSLANGVGAGRMRQAVREFVKAYAMGVTLQEFDELFAMFAWNQGIGYFASEIGPSTLFGAYQFAKDQEKKGNSREEVTARLLDKFGEDNPEVSAFYRKK